MASNHSTCSVRTLQLLMWTATLTRLALLNAITQRIQTLLLQSCVVESKEKRLPTYNTVCRPQLSEHTLFYNK